MMVKDRRGGNNDGPLAQDAETSRHKLMCEACGHTWYPRNTSGSSRHCSECNSRQIVEVDSSIAPSSEINPKHVEVISERTVLPIPLREDTDIRKKLKELELARLDKQIRELKSSTTPEVIVEKIVANNILLLDALYRNGAIDENEYQLMASACPWCGAAGDEGLVYEEVKGSNGNRCVSCGHWVPY